jgi:hypothetical protein
MFAAVIIAAVAGLIAVLKSKERSIIVCLAIPLGIAFFLGIVMLLIGNSIGPPIR